MKVPQLSPWNVHTTLHLQDDSGLSRWDSIVFRGTGALWDLVGRDHFDGQVAGLPKHLGHAEMFAMLVWSLEKLEVFVSSCHLVTY